MDTNQTQVQMQMQMSRKVHASREFCKREAPEVLTTVDCERTQKDPWNSEEVLGGKKSEPPPAVA